MAMIVDRARDADIDQLLSLYFLVYGHTYPFKICTDRKEMTAAIHNTDDYIWLVVRNEEEGGAVVASAIFETDRANRIGKLAGVVVNPEFRQHGLAYKMIDTGCRELLHEEGPLNSIYATTRTISVGPQLMCMKAGFKAFGIFPNSHRLRRYETTTLLIKFRDGIMERRQRNFQVLRPLVPLLDIANKTCGFSCNVEVVEKVDLGEGGPALDFEIVDAPHYVYRRFQEKFVDEYDRFFPFHSPNMLAVSTDGSVEIFAHLNKQDGYCAIVALNCPVYKLRGRLSSLLYRMHDIGISYVEVLIGLQHKESIQTLLDRQFLPSAIYPAMQEYNGKMLDFVVLSRTMEPLDFRGMAIESQFKPYIDQYVDLWKQAHLDSIEVKHDYI